MIPPDNDILMMMEMTARAERDAGEEGWGRPPKAFRKACDRLVDAGLAEKKDKVWYRPTTAGAEQVSPRISRVQ